MRTSEERQRLIHKRITEIQREESRKRQKLIGGAGVMLCLAFIIGLGCWLPGVTSQDSGRRVNYAAGVASVLGKNEALGYICMGILAFVWCLRDGAFVSSAGGAGTSEERGCIQAAAERTG